MTTDTHGASLEAQANSVLKKLLGSLELEVMSILWQTGKATVQEVTDRINLNRRVAYTTIMTVMLHLVDKGLLTRIRDGKKYLYKVTLTKREFVRESAKSRLQHLIGDFGYIAIAQFLEEAQNIDPNNLERLKNLVQKGSHESNTAEQDI